MELNDYKWCISETNISGYIVGSSNAYQEETNYIVTSYDPKHSFEVYTDIKAAWREYMIDLWNYNKQVTHIKPAIYEVNIPEGTKIFQNKDCDDTKVYAGMINVIRKLNHTEVTQINGIYNDSVPNNMLWF